MFYVNKSRELIDITIIYKKCEKNILGWRNMIPDRNMYWNETKGYKIKLFLWVLSHPKKWWYVN
jgi:hypothetical protein